MVPASVPAPNSARGQVSVPEPSSLLGVFALATLSIGLGWKRKKLCAAS
ncbi:PEP-CTERM sorting domain-containing protein [Iningainema tapete]|uniref:PEP-CTERM sorting domain-containing protein n=1 Tax=Iningainema tapete BLCC-T55 TaxID=2748662 RepID=A0A8J6XEP4_9CYAN|nr:PEP-CTERM sorting domain-containing protein [Iningainema tapete BLCC-T55]